MVEVALKLQAAIDLLVVEDSKLKEYKITPDEWSMLGEFSHVFNVSVYSLAVQERVYSTCWWFIYTIYDRLSEGLPNSCQDLDTQLLH